jgi:hypothetical protein
MVVTLRVSPRSVWVADRNAGSTALLSSAMRRSTGVESRAKADAVVRTGGANQDIRNGLITFSPASG